MRCNETQIDFCCTRTNLILCKSECVYRCNRAAMGECLVLHYLLSGQQFISLRQYQWTTNGWFVSVRKHGTDRNAITRSSWASISRCGCCLICGSIISMFRGRAGQDTGPGTRTGNRLSAKWKLFPCGCGGWLSWYTHSGGGIMRNWELVLLSCWPFDIRLHMFLCFCCWWLNLIIEYQ